MSDQIFEDALRDLEATNAVIGNAHRALDKAGIARAPQGTDAEGWYPDARVSLLAKERDDARAQRDAIIAALGFSDDVAQGRDPVDACTEMRGCYINALDQYGRADRAEKERDEWRGIAERTSAELSKEERMSHELRAGLDELREAHHCSVEMGNELVRAAAQLTTERDNQSILIRNLHDTEAVLERDLLEARTRLATPVPMRLICPACNSLHVDEGWDGADKPHHTHACQGCGAVWRPAIVATVGVRFLPGFKNEGAPK